MMDRVLVKHVRGRQTRVHFKKPCLSLTQDEVDTKNTLQARESDEGLCSPNELSGNIFARVDRTHISAEQKVGGSQAWPANKLNRSTEQTQAAVIGAKDRRHRNTVDVFLQEFLRGRLLLNTVRQCTLWMHGPDSESSRTGFRFSQPVAVGICIIDRCQSWHIESRL